MEHDEQTGMAPETAGRFIARVAAAAAAGGAHHRVALPAGHAGW